MKCNNCNNSSQTGPCTTCDGCNAKVHLKCVGLDADDRITRSKSKSIKILCNICNKSWNDVGGVKCFQDFLNSLKVSIETQITALNEKLDKITHPDLSRIESSIAALQEDFEEFKQKGNSGSSTNNVIESVIQEISERV